MSWYTASKNVTFKHDRKLRRGRETPSGNKLRSLFLAAPIRSGSYTKLASYFTVPHRLLSFIDANQGNAAQTRVRRSC